MAPTLLFITGALAGLIAGCTLRPSLVQWFSAVAAPGAGSS
ncbi:hypothetical protein [Synechococcus sp. HK01-R]|nr:hypothetical protein [Synechococcus sp. HK01-R]